VVDSADIEDFVVCFFKFPAAGFGKHSHGGCGFGEGERTNHPGNGPCFWRIAKGVGVVVLRWKLLRLLYLHNTSSQSLGGIAFGMRQHKHNSSHSLF
jgi:hypothetical protein